MRSTCRRGAVHVATPAAPTLNMATGQRPKRKAMSEINSSQKARRGKQIRRGQDKRNGASQSNGAAAIVVVVVEQTTYLSARLVSIANCWRGLCCCRTNGLAGGGRGLHLHRLLVLILYPRCWINIRAKQPTPLVAHTRLF